MSADLDLTAAVEAAAHAWVTSARTTAEWERMSPHRRRLLTDRMRLSIEAAAPHIAAAVVDGVCSVLWEREKRHKDDQDLAAELSAARNEIRSRAAEYEQGAQ